MRKTVRPNVNTRYSLHDMGVAGFTVNGDTLTLSLPSGMIRAGTPCAQVEGFVEFEGVQWDFSYVYLLHHTGNTGSFSSEKLFLRDFINRCCPCTLTVMDETYGYHKTKYSGYYLGGDEFCECIVEICHEGDMVFVENTAYEGLSEVILSHDGEAMLCRVPAEVAENLDLYCLEFASQWVWHGPENGRFLHRLDGSQVCAVFGAPDFIDYLQRWAFPGQGAAIVRGLGCSFDAVPKEYAHLPCFNF